MDQVWEELGIDPTNDRRAIKRAYAKRLKQTRPDESAEEFQQLRHAYEAALQLAEWYEFSEVSESHAEFASPQADVTDGGDTNRAQDAEAPQHADGEHVEHERHAVADEGVGDSSDSAEELTDAPSTSSPPPIHEAAASAVARALQAEDILAAVDDELAGPTSIALDYRAVFEGVLISHLVDMWDGDPRPSDAFVRLVGELSKRFEWRTVRRVPPWLTRFYEFAADCEGALAAEEHLRRLAESEDSRQAFHSQARLLMDMRDYKKRDRRPVADLAGRMRRKFGTRWDQFIPAAGHAERAEIESSVQSGWEGPGCAVWIFGFLAVRGLVRLLDQESANAAIGGVVMIVILCAVVWYLINRRD